MITIKTWEELKKKQSELDQLIVEKSPTNLKWISHFNAERLKLALLVEVGEFANEIKSFKAWRKKQEIDWAKAKEELIDCLGYFLGLVNIYQIDFPANFTSEKQDWTFNKLLLDFFAKTNNLFIPEEPELYDLEKAKITNQSTYHNWLKIFNEICNKIPIGKQELLEVYLQKNRINQERSRAK